MALIAYGLTEGIPAQLNRTVAEVGRYLRDFGITGVFLKHLDPEWCAALQESGLDVYASHGIFVANDGLWQDIPESRPITAAGTPAPVEEWYRPALPSSTAVRELRLRQLDGMLRDLPLDGLWLDFIRWPARWEKRQPNLYHSSFDAATLRRFLDDTGIELMVADPQPAAADWILTNAADVWHAWRCAQIASFVDEARALLAGRRPDALLGAFTVPWTGGPLDGLPVEQANIRIVGQDPALLGPRVDVLSPMVYHRLCGRDADWPGQVTSMLSEQVGCEVWPTVEAIVDDVAYGADEFASVCESAHRAGGGGLVVFNLAGLLSDSEKLPALARH